jgi:CRISPR-associated protein Cmr6
MSTPLPQGLHGAQLLEGGNSGLWYNKFCSTWINDNPDEPPWSLKTYQGNNPKLQWMKTVTHKPCGSAALLKNACQRIKALTHERDGCYFVLKNIERFVTGLGLEHPIENGFAWHHTLGVPFLPGSSIKGALRSYLAEWTDVSADTIKRVFGPEKPDQTNVGSVVFLDALPVSPAKLEADIITPHYGPYYADKNDSTAPGDWHTPSPTPFLAVAKSTEMQFAVLPRTSSEEDIEDCKYAESWLREELRTVGIGAKTAIGYGRFFENEKG